MRNDTNDENEKKRKEWEAEMTRRESELKVKEADFERRKSALVTNVKQEEQDMKKVGIL